MPNFSRRITQGQDTHIKNNVKSVKIKSQNEKQKESPPIKSQRYGF